KIRLEFVRRGHPCLQGEDPADHPGHFLRLAGSLAQLCKEENSRLPGLALAERFGQLLQGEGPNSASWLETQPICRSWLEA
ncbi:Hypothetical predicted protein, partial [Prunus dulcis]